MKKPDDLKTRLTSRKFWACLVALAIGTTVALLAPASATIPFFGFLVAMVTIYLGANVAEYKVRTPFLEAESEDADG